MGWDPTRARQHGTCHLSSGVPPALRAAAPMCRAFVQFIWPGAAHSSRALPLRKPFHPPDSSPPSAIAVLFGSSPRANFLGRITITCSSASSRKVNGPTDDCTTYTLSQLLTMRTTAVLRMSNNAALRFVPESSSLPHDGDVERFRTELAQLKQPLVLTGAGVSTESGIPDYRSPRAPGKPKPNPITIQEFLKSAAARQRYWARNYVAWPAFRAVKPNATHLALADAERAGRLHWLITQNVDTLHHKAGSSNVTELHGNGSVVKCVKCNARHSRDHFQQLIEALNPDWSAEAREIAPDGDVVIPDSMISAFRTPWCEACGPREGIFKTDVIFFGDNVPKSVVEFCTKKVAEADGLLVLGSSLEVFSGFRFVRQTLEQGKPLFMVNIGTTRADALCSTPNKLRCRCSDVVPTFFPPLN